LRKTQRILRSNRNNIVRQVPGQIPSLILLVLCLSAGAVSGSAQNARAPENAIKQANKSSAALERALANANERIPKALLDKAMAVAVLPDVKKVSMIFEGAGVGRGVVARRGANGEWSPPAFIRLGALSIGPQIKSMDFDVIVLFMNEQAAGWLLDDKAVIFDRAKAPVAGPVGEIRTEDKQVVPVADVFAYVFEDNHLKGKDLKNIFKNFGFSYDNDLNKATYNVKAGAVLSGDKAKITRLPGEVMVFTETVKRLFNGAS
jgi:lipid-binding SYLF domain-containing protein